MRISTQKDQAKILEVVTQKMNNQDLVIDTIITHINIMKNKIDALELTEALRQIKEQ